MSTIRTDNVRIASPSVAVGHGYDVDTGDEVTYAAEPRMLADIALAIEDGELPEAYIEDWQEMSRVQLGAVAPVGRNDDEAYVPDMDSSTP